MNRIDRRDFAKHASLAFLSGVSVIVSACGGSGYSSPSSPPLSPDPEVPGDELGQISANHGHRAVITAAELMAGGALQLDIRGEADHTHTVSLSARSVQDVHGGAAVETLSTTTESGTLPAHAHAVTFNPASSTPGSPGY